MTKEERRLWFDFLKQLPVTVNRQKVIDRYIVDFYCASRKLVIELDGSQHYENEGADADRERDHALNRLGPYHGSGAMTRSPSPLAWRPDFPGAPREAH